MDNTSEKTQASNLETQGSAEGAPLTVGTRRRFTRNAVAGSAVLLSLGNRAAWADQIGTCMSTPLFHSLTPINYIASAHPQQAIADQILREGAPPNRIEDFDDNQTCSVFVDPVGGDPGLGEHKLLNQMNFTRPEPDPARDNGKSSGQLKSNWLD